MSTYILNTTVVDSFFRDGYNLFSSAVINCSSGHNNAMLPFKFPSFYAITTIYKDLIYRGNIII